MGIGFDCRYHPRTSTGAAIGQIPTFVSEIQESADCRKSASSLKGVLQNVEINFRRGL